MKKLKTAIQEVQKSTNYDVAAWSLQTFERPSHYFIKLVQ